MAKFTLQELEATLWQCADILRGELTGAEYKDYIYGGNPKNLSLFGQEINLSTWAICKMNMLFHGAKGKDIQKGDTIREPKHTEGGALKVFDKVLAIIFSLTKYRAYSIR